MRISDWSSDVCSSDLSKDGRIRGLLQYHGAGTGRWAGRLVQPQNFPRPFVKEKMDVLVDVIKRKDVETLDYLYGSAMDARSEERSVGKECVITCRSRW